jgi:RimJ/RimL family protein N-acetyltransferase
MTTRTKSFGEDFHVSPAQLYYGPILVKTLSLKESIDFFSVREKNSDSIDPYQIVDTSKKPKISFGIYFKGTPVGEVTIWNIRDNLCNISYWIDENYRNRGIASVSIALVLDHLYTNYEIEEVEAPILDTNESSKELIKKLFFTLSGYEIYTGKDGVPRSHEVYLQLKPSEYEELSLIQYVEGRYSFDE